MCIPTDKMLVALSLDDSVDSLMLERRLFCYKIRTPLLSLSVAIVCLITRCRRRESIWAQSRSHLLATLRDRRSRRKASKWAKAKARARATNTEAPELIGNMDCSGAWGMLGHVREK